MTEPTLLPCELSPLSGTTSLSKPHFGSTLPELETGTPVPVFDSPCGKRAKGKTEILEHILRRLESFAFYCTETGEFIATKQRAKNAPPIGAPLGTVKDGYKVLWVTFLFRVHHLVWLWHYGVLPKAPKEIDHINGCRNNNRIENLREVTRSQNTKNRGPTSRSITGITGVWPAANTPNLPWEAKLRVNERLVLDKRFKTLDEAIAARKEAELQYGFTSTDRPFYPRG